MTAGINWGALKEKAAELKDGAASLELAILRERRRHEEASPTGPEAPGEAPRGQEGAVKPADAVSSLRAGDEVGHQGQGATRLFSAPGYGRLQMQVVPWGETKSGRECEDLIRVDLSVRGDDPVVLAAIGDRIAGAVAHGYPPEPLEAIETPEEREAKTRAHWKAPRSIEQVQKEDRRLREDLALAQGALAKVLESQGESPESLEVSEVARRVVENLREPVDTAEATRAVFPSEVWSEIHGDLAKAERGLLRLQRSLEGEVATPVNNEVYRTLGDLLVGFVRLQRAMGTPTAVVVRKGAFPGLGTVEAAEEEQRGGVYRRPTMALAPEEAPPMGGLAPLDRPTHYRDLWERESGVSHEASALVRLRQWMERVVGLAPGEKDPVGAAIRHMDNNPISALVHREPEVEFQRLANGMWVVSTPKRASQGRTASEAARAFLDRYHLDWQRPEPQEEGHSVRMVPTPAQTEVLEALEAALIRVGHPVCKTLQEAIGEGNQLHAVSDAALAEHLRRYLRP